MARAENSESLIRQILLGQAFWQEEFGVEVKNMWEPDVFGYSAALPQILKRSGVDYMMTQKLSWNTVNFFPHHSFKWQGVDGTVALVHTLPEETYNSPALPRAVHKVATNYREAGASDHALMLFGIGDGGGGPGLWEIWTTGFGTKLATLTFSATAFGAAATGVATAAAITDDSSADADGTAAVFRVTSSAPATIYEGTVSTSGADLNLNTVSITTGDTVSITSATMTMPAS